MTKCDKFVWSEAFRNRLQPLFLYVNSIDFVGWGRICWLLSCLGQFLHQTRRPNLALRPFQANSLGIKLGIGMLVPGQKTIKSPQRTTLPLDLLQRIDAKHVQSPAAMLEGRNFDRLLPCSTVVVTMCLWYLVMLITNDYNERFTAAHPRNQLELQQFGKIPSAQHPASTAKQVRKVTPVF